MKKVTIVLLLVTLLILIIWFFKQNSRQQETSLKSLTKSETPAKPLDPLTIEAMRAKKYPGSEIIIEETLAPGANYNRYIASYRSDGLKIYGLLTIPTAATPSGGFAAINFIHGHLDEATYTPTERYVAYQDGFAKVGYVTFKPDLRGHGKSEGKPVQSNFSPGYVTDALNSVGSLQKMPQVNPKKIGMWGHSMGGGITLRSMVVSPDIKVGVIWAGVVGDYEDLIERYRKRIPWLTNSASPMTRSALKEALEKYGSPSAQNNYWKEIDPYNYLSEISGPIQLHHGTLDDSVPIEFSEHLNSALKKAGKTSEYYSYEGSDHNIAQGFSQAMQRSIAFFDKYLK